MEMKPESTRTKSPARSYGEAILKAALGAFIVGSAIFSVAFFSSGLRFSEIDNETFSRIVPIVIQTYFGTAPIFVFLFLVVLFSAKVKKSQKNNS